MSSNWERRRVSVAWTVVLALVVALVGCGGGGGSSARSADAGSCDGTSCPKAPAEAGVDGPTAGQPDAPLDGVVGTPDASGDTGRDLATDPTIASNLAFTSAALYSGSNPVQVGVAPGTIDLKRAAVIRGLVQERAAAADAGTGLAPLAGVTVSIVGHPELGTTTTQSDGWYSIAVNGGGLLNVAFAKTGYIAAQRRALTRWLEYTITKPVVLTVPEPGTSVTLSSTSTAFQVVRGQTHGTASSMTPTEDADGSRTATLLIPPGTTASIAGLNDIATTLRATEFTTGSAGVQAMPADLPPTSAYTYAVDLSIDEANGAPVTFSQPVLFYVDNFIGFPVGDGTNATRVPSGYFDANAGQWIASPSGQVVKVLTNAAGTVTLDLTGNGQDSPDAAFTPPLVAGERAQIAALYKAGSSFWRVGLPHFSWWDFNWGKGPPPGAVAPNAPPPNPNNPDDHPCKARGSIIECENQVLAEELPVAGTSFGLRYQSDRSLGRTVSIQVPISGSTPLPSVLSSIVVLIETEGRQWSYYVPNDLTANQFVTWTWDRKDYRGVEVSGHTDVQVSLGYNYIASSSYQPTGMFGAYGNGTPITGNRALSEITIWQFSSFTLDLLDAKLAFGLGGLSLTPQNLYDPFGQTFYGGDGSRRTVTGNHFSIIDTYAGGATGNASGVPATSVGLTPAYLAVAPDGTLFIADNTFVRTVDPTTKLITTFAGSGADESLLTGNPDDGAPATSAALSVNGVAIGPDGAVYVTTEFTHRVRRIDPTTATITTIAGTGTTAESCAPSDLCADGQPAKGIGLGVLGGVKVGPDGCVYFSESFGGTNGGRVRKIEQNGTLSTVINGLSGPSGLAFGPEGSLYVVDTTNYSVTRRWPDGTVAVVAGGKRGNGGDGGPATSASLFEPNDVAVDDDGGLYISDTFNFTIRAVDTNGIIRTITNPNSFNLAVVNQVTDDKGPAGAASLYEPLGLAIGPGHALYIADSVHQRVRVIRPALPGFTLADSLVPSEDGSLIYRFDQTGRHQSTYDAWKGQTLLSFAYDANGYLSSLTDDAGNVTTIDRCVAGSVVVQAPFGQRTTIALDSGGYAGSVSDSNAESVGLGYEAPGGAENGLLTTLTDPKGQVHKFTYTPDGFLTEDDNPAGGARKLARTNGSANGWTVTHTTKMGYVSSYVVSTPTAGGFQRVTTTPTGATSTYVEAPDGSRTTTETDAAGAVLATNAVQLAADPRWQMVAPISSHGITTLSPSGLALELVHTRTATYGTSPFDLQQQVDVTTLNPSSPQPQTFTATYTGGSSTNTYAVTTTTGRTITSTLDANDRVIAVTVPGLAPTTFTYNTAPCPAGGEGCGGRLTSATSTSATEGTRTWVTHYGYTPDVGFPSSAVDPLGRAVSWLRDPVGRPKQTQLPDLAGTTDMQNQVVTTYDLNGNLSSLSVPSVTSPAPLHGFPTYTPIDALQTYAPPAVSPPLALPNTSFVYNADGQLSAITVPDGVAAQTLGTAYDAFGRPSTLTDSKSGVTRTYAFRPGGEPASVTTSDGETLAFTFGTDGPLLMATTWSGPVAGSVAVTHDSFFRTATRTVNAGAALTYQYDADGLLSGTSGLAALTLTRDFNGPNGLLTSTTVGGVSEAITYNTFGEPKTFASTFGATGVYAASFTSLDPLGRIASMSETLTGATHAWGFAYDEHGNLSSATRDGAVTAYTYDPNGNRLTAAGQASTYDAQDRILTSPGVTYAYTNNGDLLSRTTASGTTTYAYDLLGALRSVSLPTGDTVAYAIDGAGRRLGRTWTHGASTLTQGFLYDDQYRVAAELDGQNNVVSTFVYATHANVPDVMVRAGVTYRIVSDWRGSVRAVVDVSAGTVVQKADYDPWGVATVTDTTCATGQLCVPFQPFGFSGGLADRETGLVRFGARDYDPSIGRWTQKDASGLGGGLNVYAYVGNDPINAFDMTGYNAVNDFANWAVPVASSVINFAWGVDNAVLGGVPNFVAHTLGLDDQYSRCSTAYKVGSGVGQVAMLVDGVGAAGVGGGAAEGADFAAHAAMRADLGLPAMGAEGSGALARLEAGGQEFWGINAHGQSVSPLSVNAISATHAEADAFAQAARAGVNGGTGRLIVDRALCPACGTFGAVRSMARQLGLESLEVVTPAGTSTLIP